MAARLIDGVAVANSVRQECRARVAHLHESTGVVPGLAVLMVGHNHASAVNVRNKVRASAEVGVRSELHEFGEDADPEEVRRKIAWLNDDTAIHGILVQLPLPPSWPVSSILRTISQDKDVDGLHLYDAGALVAGDTVFPPGTPYGVVKLLEHEDIPLVGQNVVVVGASNVVAKPIALMLMQREATVCICHANTRGLAQFTILADVLVVAAGRPNLILPQMVKTGAVVIDVGINRLGDRLVGDVDFDGVAEKASYITPVPGGVEPMTVTMLLANTIASAERAAAQQAARNRRLVRWLNAGDNL